VQTAIRIVRALGLYGPAKSLWNRIEPLTPGWRRRQREMAAFYAGFIPPGSLCFDIGANAGNRTEIFLMLGAKVIAVEPQSSCVRTLESRFGDNGAVTIVRNALGAEPGSADIHIGDADTISSLSRTWIENVRASGRFASYSWNRSETVPVTTFDALIREYGVPAFAKIDVEGYEYEVLRGLSRPVGTVSFEFTPEYLEPALASIRRLNSLGRVAFNYSLGETMTLSLDDWVGAAAMTSILTTLPDTSVFGDVYARFA